MIELVLREEENDVSNDEALYLVGLVNFSAPLKSCHYDSTGTSAKGTEYLMNGSRYSFQFLQAVIFPHSIVGGASL